MERIPTHQILARAMPVYTRSGFDFSCRPLQDHIWCLVRTENGKFEYTLLSECQKKMKSGEAKYEDVDMGIGIHPDMDKVWVYTLKSQRNWPPRKSQVEQVVHLREKNYTTVLLSTVATEEKNPQVGKQKDHPTFEELKRVPLSMFPRRLQLRYRKDIEGETLKHQTVGNNKGRPPSRDES